LSNVVAIGAGDYHSLAAKADGSVLAWGDNSQGQCDLQPLTNIVAVAGGGFHSVALGAGGTVAAWGDNWNGQCTFPPNVSNVVQIATGDSHTILLVGNGPGGPQILRARRSGNQFRVLVQTFSGNNYALEFKSSLIAAGWTAIVTNYGNGALQFLTDPAANGPQRFYRVRQW